MCRRVSLPPGNVECNCEQSFTYTWDSGGQFIVMDADSVAVLETWNTSTSVRLQWLDHRNKVSAHWGCPRTETNPARARRKFGDGCLARCAARPIFQRGLQVIGAVYGNRPESGISGVVTQRCLGRPGWEIGHLPRHFGFAETRGSYSPQIE